MKPMQSIRTILLIGSALALSACDSNNSGGGGSGIADPSTEFLNLLARSPSETDLPISINDGLFVFNDTSETSSPRPINGGL
ncbi:MAG: hypothetical protein ACT4PZ_07080 [Panacagrimonas sp.]